MSRSGRFDVVISGGRIVDGTKKPRYTADVGIAGGRIAAIGDLRKAQAAQSIDASGKIVAPGFIDVHNHSDGWMLKRRHLLPKTTQGFTTEVLMSDGISYAPVNDQTARQWLFYLRALDGLRLDEYGGWQGFAEFMGQLAGRNVQNAAALLPYANVRSLVCGFGSRPPDDFEMRSIQAEIRKGMSEGAVGLSTGLDYIVQCFSTTDELVEVCRSVAEFDGLYVTHVRYKKGLLPALAEAVEIGRRSGVRVHVSHLKPQSNQQSEEVLSYIDNVVRKQVDFSFDLYPYQPGSTMLSYLLPYEVWENGPIASLAKLTDPELRGRFRRGLDAYRLDLDHIRIAWVAGKENSQHQGKRLSAYVDEMGVAAEDALADLLIEERLAVLLVFDEGDDALVEPFLQHDLSMIGTDGIFTEDGPVHPRMYGSTGRLLGSCVRKSKLFSLEDAVYKLSGFAADRFGLTGRGVLREGAAADVVVFDERTITDHATYDNPRRYTTGVEAALTAGVPIICDATPVEALPDPLPGRFLKFRAE